jgi:hypothetical protein
MNIPFTFEQLLDLFEMYNHAISPMQMIAYVLGGGALFFAIKKTKYSSKIVASVLAFFWLWCGVVFQMMYFTRIFKPALFFGILFIIQFLLFKWAGVLKTDLSFRFKPDAYSLTGIVFILYGMVGYLILGYFLGHVYPQAPPFGLASCPVTAFTFGLLLWTDKKVPKYILIIPLLWSIGGLLPGSMGFYEDLGLVAVGVLGTLLILCRDKKRG